MCKVMMINGIKNETRQNAIAFIKEMAKDLSVSNRDGLGYAAVTSDGSLFGERWTNNDQAFKPKRPVLLDPKDVFGDALNSGYSYNTTSGGEYNSFGDVDAGWNDIVAITLHTRYATTPKGLMNTHPFISGDTSLIHNGVINNHDNFKKTSTCDSEAILISYLENTVHLDMAGVLQMAQDIKGYYACGVFTRNTVGDRVMDVFKGNHASLSVAYVKNLDAFVFSTMSKDIDDVCKRLSFTVGKSSEVREGHLLRINPITGGLIDKKTFVVTPAYTSQNWNYNGYNSNYNNSNVVDVSTKGNRKLKTDVSQEKIELLGMLPSIRKLSASELRDLAI